MNTYGQRKMLKRKKEHRDTTLHTQNSTKITAQDNRLDNLQGVKCRLLQESTVYRLSKLSSIPCYMRICIFWRPSLVHCSWEGRSPIDVQSQRSMYCTVLSVPVLCASCIVPEPRNCTSTWYKNSIVLQTSTAFSTAIKIRFDKPGPTHEHPRKTRQVCVCVACRVARYALQESAVARVMRAHPGVC